jgi:hypothetical protein
MKAAEEFIKENDKMMKQMQKDAEKAYKEQKKTTKAAKKLMDNAKKALDKDPTNSVLEDAFQDAEMNYNIELSNEELAKVAV